MTEQTPPPEPASGSYWRPAPALPPQPEYRLPPPPDAQRPFAPPRMVLPPARSYATWFHRVLAAIADNLAVLPILFVGYFLAFLVSQNNPWDAFTVLVLTVLAALVFTFWNVVVRQGITGATLGKSWLGIRVVRLETGVEPGIGLSFARSVLHVLDTPFLLGYLWPLWDARNQTFSDKVVGTVVVLQRS